MISYYNDICITEVICFGQKLALISEDSPFSTSNEKIVSDIGKIDEFYIIDVKKFKDSYIHITSLNFQDFKEKYKINKIEDILKNKLKAIILNISRNSIKKKKELINIINDKFPFDLCNYYISRFGLLLVFNENYFDKNKIISKLTEKCISLEKTNLLPFYLLVKYHISNKFFIWLYFPEDLSLIQQNYFTKNFLEYYDLNLLFKPLYSSIYKITTPKFEIFENIYPTIIPSVYLSIYEEIYNIFYFNEKKTEIIQDKNIQYLLKYYSEIAYKIIK